jgi:hypothetical protein
MGNDSVQGRGPRFLVALSRRSCVACSARMEGGRRMDLMEAIYSRRSVRSYTDQQVEKPMVEALIQAAVRNDYDS